MRRRDFITTLAGTAIAWPVEVRGQQTSLKVRRIAVVHPSAQLGDISETGDNPGYRAFFQELRLLGYIEGQNLIVERYSAEGRQERFALLAREVVDTNPELIHATSNPLVLAFKTVTDAIPIVGYMADPVTFGIVASLARPGGNITGVTAHPGLDIWGKRLEILLEAIPAASKVGFLTGAPRGPDISTHISALEEAARQAHVSLVAPFFEGPIEETEYRRVMDALIQEKVNGLIVHGYSPNVTHGRLIVDLIEKARLPAIYPYRVHFEFGGLMAYAVATADLWTRMGGYIAQILGGAKPGEIAIYQGSKFELLLNSKAAKALALTFPPSLLTRASEVIE